MKLKFLGAAKTVTGAFFLVDTENTRFAIDCGLFQGSKEIKERNYGEFLVPPETVDFLILTHAHIDHIGLVPKFCKKGFKGPIYCSHATKKLAEILLPDSAHIQEMEVARKNRKYQRAGKPLLEPIYRVDDALKCLEQFVPLNMDEIIPLHEGVEVRLRDAGHILGSNIVELWIKEDHHKLKLVFSGDLGQPNQPIIKDPAVIESADYLILESTYGNRLHEGVEKRKEQLKEIIDRTMRKGGNLIIPSFAVERTQDLLYDLNYLYHKGLLPPDIKIYIDSPLAVAATQIFQENTEYYDYETRKLVAEGKHPLKLPNLKFSVTQEDSVALNQIKGKAIIISASGMCEAGRIKHHLKHNLWRPESTILFVGYQAEGTLGRKILEGEKVVKIHGEEIAVKAEIERIEAYSAHADREGLLSWLKAFVSPPQEIFLVHGEEEAQSALAEIIQKELKIPVYIPEWGEEIELPCKHEQAEVSSLLAENMPKALEAEKLYLATMSIWHEKFARYWANGDYDKMIDDLKKMEQVLKP
ncbi:metallo-beta-lactamase family protein [Thermosyntropha lipolytica DSM 11003]|uniref:Metallo-beta-lactamase family protein n=1 Tax=Thermosyntropha lipolytica DSM 11003 TaxID=1123382 RepID=A0A1M5L7D5_9FIRM|nr:MBL fold metallo-hydrolase [Thermosyntropha lipolytica]SHG60876.1 metallo-beta-lactamase family protein [Thermosyntropha lipolytica DSM 11003]